MRPNQQNNNNKQRSRGRNNSNNTSNNNNNNNRRGGNPLSRNYESNGPDVRVRGNAAHIAEKYVQLARDASSMGDGVMAENYLQHAEHYFRIISAAQVQNQQRGDSQGAQDRDDRDDDDDSFDDGPRQHASGDAPQQRDTRDMRDNRDQPRDNRDQPRDNRDKRDAARGPSENDRGDEGISSNDEQRPRRQRRPRRMTSEGSQEGQEGQAGQGVQDNPRAQESEVGNDAAVAPRAPAQADAGERPVQSADAEADGKPRRARRPRRKPEDDDGSNAELPAFLTGRETAAE